MNVCYVGLQILDKLVPWPHGVCCKHACVLFGAALQRAYVALQGERGLAAEAAATVQLRGNAANEWRMEAIQLVKFTASLRPMLKEIEKIIYAENILNY